MLQGLRTPHCKHLPFEDTVGHGSQWQCCMDVTPGTGRKGRGGGTALRLSGPEIRVL